MIKKVFLTISSFMLIAGLIFSANNNNKKNNRNLVYKNFDSAKKAIYQNLTTRTTFYCSCPFNSRNQVDIEACKYKPRKDPKRARRVEMEHVVPAAKLCGKTREWTGGSEKCVTSKGKRYKGRKCASNYNDSCRAAYNDLHNLRPAIGEVNNDRKDYGFSEISGFLSPYGSCNFIIENQKADPPDNVQGDIARIYLHMNDAYPELQVLNPDEVSFFNRWSKGDPVTKEECSYNDRLYKLQGTINSYVKKECDLK